MHGYVASQMGLPKSDPFSIMASTPIEDRTTGVSCTGTFMLRFRRIFWLLLVVALMAGCTSSAADTNDLQGPQSDRLLIWHTWTDEDAVILAQMLDAYRELNPGVDVISVAVPKSAFVARYADSNAAGFGPDLILSNASIIYQLAERDLIRDLMPLQLDLSNFLSNAVQMVSDGTHLYALPFAGHTNVLYYNRDLVESAPETIPELLQRVKDGDTVAQNPGFIESYWGIGAYDGGIADSQRRLVFGQGGFTNWLDFLRTARALPGFILNDDPQELQQAFIDGEATYYIGDSDELTTLRAAMGEDSIGVALLPFGPNGGSPRPFLGLDALAFNPVSSADEMRRAYDLAQFLTGSQNQLFLARADLGRVPLNTRIRLTPGLPANTLTVASQSRSSEAVSYVNRGIWEDLQAGALGFFDSYRQAIQGIITPSDMVERALANFAEAYDVYPPPNEAGDLCPAETGTLTIWHSLDGAPAKTFEDMVSEFNTACPGNAISTVYVAPDEIYDRFAAEARRGAGPDVLFESSRWLGKLAEEELILDLSETVNPDFLQQFLPEAVQSMRFAGRLYGIPESLNTVALFYNPTMISDPPNDLHAMMLTVDADRRAALPVSFFYGYWGMDPFGGFDFDSYSGEVLKADGLAAWLETLRTYDAQPGVDLYFERAAAEDAFAAGEAAYLVSGPWSLDRLQQDLGEDQLRVVPLPNGPLQAGSPMLQVRGVMVNANASDSAAGLALAFGRFLSQRASQQQFMDAGGHVTASVIVDLSEHPNLESFREQAKVAAQVVETNKFVTMEQLGDQLYQAVLVDGADPVEAVQTFVEAVHEANEVP